MSIVSFDRDRPLDMIALGRIAIDFNPEEYCKPWSECSSFKRYVGGSPANIAVGAARLGKKVGFLGCVSNDVMGTCCKDFLEQEKVDVSHIFTAQHGESMPLAFTQVPSPEESSLVMYRNHAADLALTAQQVDKEYVQSAGMIVISGTALAASPSREAALKAALLARKAGTLVVFDIDYRGYTWKDAEEISVYYTLMGRMSDIIMGSREEYDIMDAVLAPGMEDRQTADRWLGENAKIVVIKHGRQGSDAYTGEGECYHVQPFPVKAVKGFGGGDGYASSFLCALLEGFPVNECLERGSASAAMLVASHGCSSFMPDREQLEAFIHKEKQRYGEIVSRRESGDRGC